MVYQLLSKFRAIKDKRKVVCIVSILFIVALVYGFKSFYFATEYSGENIVIGIIDDGVSNIALENVLEYNGPTIIN